MSVLHPRFRIRLDAWSHFGNLPMEVIERIVTKALDDFNLQLAEKKVRLVARDSVVKFLAEKGYSREFGARNISRLVEDKIKSFFVDEVLFGRLEKGGTAVADLVDGQIVFSVEPQATEVVFEKAEEPAAVQP